MSAEFDKLESLINKVLSNQTKRHNLFMKFNKDQELSFQLILKQSRKIDRLDKAVKSHQRFFDRLLIENRQN